MELSVIIPTYNEEATIEKTLEAIRRLVNVNEIIVVDGGSEDRTAEIVENYEKVKNLRFVQYELNLRGAQLNEGTKYATGDIFWFIHADTRPVQGSGKQIKKFMNYSEVLGGNFDVIFSGNRFWARFMTWLYPHLRSMGLAYGDSAFFVRREEFEKMGGFESFPLFEDVDFYKRLRKRGRFVHIRMPVTPSSLRFDKGFFLWTFIKWSVRQGFYSIGVPPRMLVKEYWALW